MTAQTLTLSAFLLARIAEDERGADGRRIPNEIDCPCGESGYLDHYGITEGHSELEITHVVGVTRPSLLGSSILNHGGKAVTATHVFTGADAEAIRAMWPLSADSRRVLAECEAKRRIVERCSAVDFAMPSTHLAHGILAELARPYVDHPDYRPDWRP